jgi:hypothetical protein
MQDGLDTPTPGTFMFHYRDAVRDRRLGRGFGLIEDDIHALIEYTCHGETFSKAEGTRYVKTRPELGGG